MQRLLTHISLALSLALLGCDRHTDKASAPSPTARPNQVSGAATSEPAAPTTAPAPTNPSVVSAGLHLNEAKAFIDVGKFDEADAKLNDVASVKDKITAAQQARLSSLQTVSKAGRNMMRALAKPPTPDPKSDPQQ
ncbi:MAG TPA: hypothetical protein VFC78_03005 [Tepidisphaeraceae bacterium]|nr:hypothetical protein [Tepidisphaeraceae bacterium]